MWSRLLLLGFLVLVCEPYNLEEWQQALEWMEQLPVVHYLTN